MARHGENIRRRTDGRWEGRYKMFDEKKGRYIYRSVYGNNYVIVKEKLSRFKLGLTDTTSFENSLLMERGCTQRKPQSCVTVLFSHVAQEWLADIIDKRKYSTYVKYKTVYVNHLVETIGFCQLSNTTASEIQEKLFEHVSEAMLSESLQKSIYCIVNQILLFANRKYSVNVPLVERSGIKHKYKPIKTFSKSEQSRLLSGIYDGPNSFKIAILLCLYTGLRLGELCALKWTDFDIKNLSVTVSRTVQRIAAQGCATKTILLETAPKSEGSKRTIPLTTEIIELLALLNPDCPYVFGGDKPLEPRTLQYRFKKLLTKMNIADKNFHVLRHTFATNCIENGMDVKALSEILGHSDVKITLNRYVHPTMESKRKQLGLLSDFYGQILGHIC